MTYMMKPLAYVAVIALGFLSVILIGAFLLALPVSHSGRVEVTPLDALFSAVSAVCVTGLVTVDTGAAYSFFGLAERGGGGNGRIGVGQFDYDVTGGSGMTAWSMKLDPWKRHRVYCYMPVLDAVPVAPETYVRKFKSWCATSTFLKKFFN